MKKGKLPEFKATQQSRSFVSTNIPYASVLLPTYNRADTLQRTLSALERQTLDSDHFEIIVVDDGSSDITLDILKKYSQTTSSRFSFACLLVNGGPARARNVGLRMCRAPVVIIIGDDVEPEATFVEKHVLYHRDHPDEHWALLGRVLFPEDLCPNTFMSWLEAGGRKYFFNYQDLDSGQLAGPLFFYTCNVSVKKSLLDKTGWFDESFPYASHEDLELGYRLAANGMRLIYDAEVAGYHWHMLSIQGITKRVYLMGYSAMIFWQKVGDEGGGFKKIVRRALAWLSTTSPLVYLWEHLKKKEYMEGEVYPLQWNILLSLSFFIGLSDSLNQRSLRITR